MALFTKASRRTQIISQGEEAKPKKSAYAGKCPNCGSQLVWRRARRTGELYRGCTTFKGECRWQDRSY